MDIRIKLSMHHSIAQLGVTLQNSLSKKRILAQPRLREKPRRHGNADAYMFVRERNKPGPMMRFFIEYQCVTTFISGISPCVPELAIDSKLLIIRTTPNLSSEVAPSSHEQRLP